MATSTTVQDVANAVATVNNDFPLAHMDFMCTSTNVFGGFPNKFKIDLGMTRGELIKALGVRFFKRNVDGQFKSTLAKLTVQVTQLVNNSRFYPTDDMLGYFTAMNRLTYNEVIPDNVPVFIKIKFKSGSVYKHAWFLTYTEANAWKDGALTNINITDPLQWVTDNVPTKPKKVTLPSAPYRLSLNDRAAFRPSPLASSSQVSAAPSLDTDEYQKLNFRGMTAHTFEMVVDFQNKATDVKALIETERVKYYKSTTYPDVAGFLTPQISNSNVSSAYRNCDLYTHPPALGNIANWPKALVLDEDKWKTGSDDPNFYKHADNPLQQAQTDYVCTNVNNLNFATVPLNGTTTTSTCALDATRSQSASTFADVPANANHFYMPVNIEVKTKCISANGNTVAYAQDDDLFKFDPANLALETSKTGNFASFGKYIAFLPGRLHNADGTTSASNPMSEFCFMLVANPPMEMRHNRYTAGAPRLAGYQVQIAVYSLPANAKEGYKFVSTHGFRYPVNVENRTPEKLYDLFVDGNFHIQEFLLNMQYWDHTNFPQSGNAVSNTLISNCSYGFMGPWRRNYVYSTYNRTNDSYAYTSVASSTQVSAGTTGNFNPDPLLTSAYTGTQNCYPVYGLQGDLQRLVYFAWGLTQSGTNTRQCFYDNRDESGTNNRWQFMSEPWNTWDSNATTSRTDQPVSFNLSNKDNTMAFCLSYINTQQSLCGHSSFQITQGRNAPWQLTAPLFSFTEVKVTLMSAYYSFASSSALSNAKLLPVGSRCNMIDDSRRYLASPSKGLTVDGLLKQIFPSYAQDGKLYSSGNAMKMAMDYNITPGVHHKRWQNTALEAVTDNYLTGSILNTFSPSSVPSEDRLDYLMSYSFHLGKKAPSDLTVDDINRQLALSKLDQKFTPASPATTDTDKANIKSEVFQKLTKQCFVNIDRCSTQTFNGQLNAFTQSFDSINVLDGVYNFSPTSGDVAHNKIKVNESEPLKFDVELSTPSGELFPVKPSSMSTIGLRVHVYDKGE
jgi:hypothetical protein